MLDSYRPSPVARSYEGEEDELDLALAVTVQRLRPLLLDFGDVHAGGLDGARAWRQRGSRSGSRELRRNRLWVSEDRA